MPKMIVSLSRIAAIAVLGLSLGGCFNTFNPNAKSILQGGPSLVSTIEQPISRNDIGAITLSYNGFVVGLNAYYSRPICNPGEQASWMNLCSEPAARRELAKYRRNARAAILKVRQFRKNNPTLSALGLVRAAGDAVADLKAVMTINGVRTQQ